MAYGGIAGIDGRRKYGLGSKFQKLKDKFVDDIIPNEIKENPMLSAAVAGGLLNQFGLPDKLTGAMGMGENVGQNWLGELLGKIPGTGGTIDTVLGKGGGQYQTLGSGIKNIFTGGANLPPQLGGPSTKQDALDYAKQYGLSKLGLNNQPRPPGTPGTPGQQDPNWMGPLSMGLGIGALDKATRKPDMMPQDTSGIDIANVRSRALTGSDPGLHFLPKGEATTAYAQGGRTRYATGDRVEQDMVSAFRDYKNAGGKEDFDEWFSDIYLPEAVREATPAMGEGLASIPTTIGYEGTGGMGDYPMQGDIRPWDMQTGTQFAAQGGRIGYADGSGSRNRMSKLMIKLANGTITDEEMIELRNIESASGFSTAQGKAEGGLMDLGGMEKDYRQEGGFVPLGGEEKADDVPARLSKNEFVFTADAVRSAGGGDIDAGAEVMENVMNNLEQGGQISEESQGLEGARDMFATAQRLEGVM